MCVGRHWSNFRDLFASASTPNGSSLTRREALQQSAAFRATRPLCAALLAVAASGASAHATPSLVTAPDGTFQGKIDATGAMLEFLGLRYTEPVTGSLRWKAPQPVTPSVATQDATRFGNHCPQAFSPYGIATQTEDCLFLNVFAPIRRGARLRSRRRPSGDGVDSWRRARGRRKQ